MKLILAIGNPEKKYEKTRHNIGVVILEEIIASLNLENPKKDKKLEAKLTKADNLLLAESQNFMNESGRTAKKISNFFNIEPEDILIIHDDSDLNIGSFKLQIGKNPAGHHGIESVVSHLGTKDFWRLRIGIRPENENGRQKAGDFVLKKISKQELTIIEKMLPKIIENIKNWTNSPI